MARIVTYAFAFTNGTVDLCATHAETVKGLGPVSHGEHDGRCAECESATMSVEEITALIESQRIHAKYFWAVAGVDPMPLPRSSVESVLAEVQA